MVDVNSLFDKDCLPKSLLLFFTNLLEGDFNNVDALLELKECPAWEPQTRQGILLPCLYP